MTAAAAERVLRANWREGRRRDGTPYAFTCPAQRRYKHQWYWDSCFHAVAWSRLDPQRGREELRTLLRAGRADGFVPHTAFWGASPRWRRAPLYATDRVWGDIATASIQTPLLAVAWERVALACDDGGAFAAEGLPALRAHARWLLRERDPDDDGLLTVLLPDESGLDDSPKYDAAYGRLAHWKPAGYARLVQRCRRHRWDARAIAATSDEHVEDVLVNVAHALSLRALARLSGEDQWNEHARRTETALLERCWDERHGLFFDLAGRAERPLKTATWSSLAPLALGDAIPRDVRERLAEQLADPRRFGARFGIPSVSMSEPSFRPGFDAFRTWRGAAWTCSTWLLVGGLRALGAADEADRIAQGALDAVERSGLREYYHPRSGAGHGERGFGMSALVLDLPAGLVPGTVQAA